MPNSEAVDVLHHSLSGSFLHTILEWSAFCAAIFTVFLAFVHFRIRGVCDYPRLRPQFVAAANDVP